MSESISINLTGAGDHVIIPAEPRVWITMSRVLLTVVVPDNSQIGLSGKAAGGVLVGPFYAQDGGTLSFEREQPPLMKCGVGEPLILTISGNGTVGGTIVIDRGQV